MAARAIYHFGFLIRMILAVFDLRVTLYFLYSFESIGISVQDNNFKETFKMPTVAAILDF